MKGKNIIIFMCMLIFLLKTNGLNAINSEVLEKDYLKEILKQTWAYLDAHLAPETGFPTDSQNAGGVTNTTNIGLYLASIGPAVEMGFIDRRDALKRVRKIIKHLNKLESHRGFLPNWISVDGETEIPRGVFAVSDFNKLITGLIMVRQFFSEVKAPATKLINRVEWDFLYDSATGNTHWGYDLKNDKPIGPGKFWLASDCRMAMFYMIATGGAPVKVWDNADRKIIEVDGLQFFTPGYEFGGLFMPAMGGIFLNEITTEMGHSIADFAWHQIREAKRLNLPVWGWSNCNIPGKGYTEGGFIPWWVVTPHASALVIEYYPKHVISNLKKLESMGVRNPIKSNVPEYGFRDSIDLVSGKVDERYLCLDQAMLFLSLTNYIENGLVREKFAQDPLVKKGLEILRKRLKGKPELIDLWAQRDNSEPEQNLTALSEDDKVAINFKSNKNISIETQTWGEGDIDAIINENGIVIDYDLGPDGTGESEVRIKMPPIDTRMLGAIKILCHGDANEIRLYLRDDQGQSQYTFIDDIERAKKEIEIKEDSRLGIFARPEAVNMLVVKFWGQPWYYSNQNTTTEKGKLVIESISFLPRKK